MRAQSREDTWMNRSFSFAGFFTFTGFFGKGNLRSREKEGR